MSSSQIGCQTLQINVAKKLHENINKYKTPLVSQNTKRSFLSQNPKDLKSVQFRHTNFPPLSWQPNRILTRKKKKSF